MIKKIIFCILYIYIPVGLFAQNTLFVTINNSECTNCLSQIANLSKLDNNIKKVLVFPKKYQKDSAYILQRLHLEKFTQNIEWSDSLYHLFQNNGGYESTVSFYNSESGKILKTVLVNLSENLNFFNSLTTKRDTLTFSKDPFGPEAQFEQRGGYYYFFDNLKKEMQVFDGVNKNYEYTLSLTDSLIKAAFNLKFGKNGKKEYAQAQSYCKRVHKIDPYIYKSYFCHEDTTWLLGVYTYVFNGIQLGLKEDTASTVFLTLSTYKKNQLVDFSLVENYIGPEFKIPNRGISRKNLGKGFENAYYILTEEFLIYNNNPYFAIADDIVPNHKNHFLAKYKKNEHAFVFDSLYDRNLPSLYLNKYGYGYLFSGHIPFASPYLALFGSDHLFSLNNLMPDIDLHYFNNDSSLPSIEKGIWDLKISNKYIYMIIMDNEIKKYCYLKYDILHRKTLVYKPICDYTSPDFITTPKIDDWDYNYVLIPISERSILRLSMLD
ncbi:MAG TPA: hypothetical protein VFL76_10030 [Edaphocola sp.]|nr:hypothetical protein [Edaphocola sp.]